MPRRWNHPTWHAGVIPEAYKDVISDMEITEARKKVSDEPKAEEADELIYGTPEEMLKRAKKDTSSEIREELVHCPNGETCRQKCAKIG